MFESPATVARMLSLNNGGRIVPVAIWHARDVHNAPLVLIGHGGSQHKTHPAIALWAQRLIARINAVVVAIDGPIHGQRRSDGLSGAGVRDEFRVMWEKDPQISAMVSDWRATIDALVGMPEVDRHAIGWFGISMGTAYGLPLIAAEPRIRAAVLGMWGTSRNNTGRLVQDAPRVQCPVLFQQKWDDEFFTREGQFELFDKLGSKDKWLKTYPGGHTTPEGGQIEDMELFLSNHLGSTAIA